MGFPSPTDFRLIVAGSDGLGRADFLDVAGPAVVDMPGVASGAVYWAVDDGHSRERFGRPPASFYLAGPNGSTFGVASFPAGSNGEATNIGGTDAGGVTVDPTDAAMHATDTIDYEVVISGKVDVELPGGKVRTLSPGDLLVMAGVPHAWRNPYDEDCTYIVVTIGYNK